MFLAVDFVSELMTGLQTTVLGLVTVFAGLFFIWAVMMILQFLFKASGKSGNKKNNLEQTAREENVHSMTVVNIAPQTPAANDQEMIAVISAAIAAYLGTTQSGIRIKAFRKISSNSSAWGEIGRQENVIR
jgi:hypothetical protein